MAILDLHVLHAIQSGSPAYLGNQAAFDELFPGIDPSMLATWRTELNTRTKNREAISYRSWVGSGVPEGARLIVVTPQSERQTEGYIGEALTATDDGREVKGFTVSEDVEILIATKRADLTRALHALVRAVLILAQGEFMAIGYRAIEYGGASPLAPEEQLMAEDLGIYIRRLTYSASLDIKIPVQQPGSSPDSKPFYVQLSGVEPDPARDPVDGAGTPGGVVPLP